MLKSWLAALAAVLVAWSPAWAQATQEKAQENVVVRSGGVVVKKIIQNGKVVTEETEVFGDLDDETRDRIMAMVKVWKPGEKEKEGRREAREALPEASVEKEVAVRWDVHHQPR